jgi:hypothetical protein
MKLLEVIKIMLTYKGNLKSEDKWEQLSGIYWNNFFIYVFVVLLLFSIAYLLKNHII